MKQRFLAAATLTEAFGEKREPRSMIQLQHRQFEILIENDPTYTFGSADNSRNYDQSYRLDDEPYTPTSLHGVRVISADNDAELASCILGATGGASGVHEHSAIINGNSLIIAVGPFVASLRLPTLELDWKTKADDATCFGVYHSQANGCYISHGELDIARVSYAGTVDWTNSGADIFTNGFDVSEDRVTAVDWNGDVYVWSIKTGEPVATTPNKAVHPSRRSGV